jgi:hypothetical protein
MPNRWLCKTALVLAIAPLLVGVVLFILLLTTRAKPLVFVAADVFLPCLVSVVLSIIGLAAFILEGVVGKSEPLVPALKLSGLILLSIPVVAAVFMAAMDVDMQYTLTVENTSRSTVTDLVIITKDYEVQIPRVAPGQRIRRVYRFSSDGPMRFTANVRGRKTEGILEDNVREGMSGDRRLVFPENKPFVVSGASFVD